MSILPPGGCCGHDSQVWRVAAPPWWLCLPGGFHACSQQLFGERLSPLPMGSMGHLQAHQTDTFSPKPLGSFLILSFWGRKRLFEYIKVLSRNALQLLRHGQVDAGLGRQLGALDQQPEDGPCSQSTDSSVQTFREESTSHPGLLRAHQSQKGPWSPIELTPGLCHSGSLHRSSLPWHCPDKSTPDAGTSLKADSSRKLP